MRSTAAVLERPIDSAGFSETRPVSLKQIEVNELDGDEVYVECEDLAGVQAAVEGKPW